MVSKRDATQERFEMRAHASQRHVRDDPDENVGLHGRTKQPRRPEAIGAWTHLLDARFVRSCAAARFRNELWQQQGTPFRIFDFDFGLAIFTAPPLFSQAPPLWLLDAEPATEKESGGSRVRGSSNDQALMTKEIPSSKF